ncbi:zinc transporter 1 [Electrophorus electricus]|uniref:zinc transporter 1 n=1 Tax=Electrophorus electricus TaxID=8005 RepID=UPI0015CF872D|nr:zinc transporter 1 [Electrophorus electricus]XP_026865909.2 zinc transporter 1 [Electrophorus electricus]XP_026865910.2 zinc transporter 1 [Electrophorus electricus]
MERSVLRFSKAHTCLLAFTSALLLCEIVVGRLCKSLINTVDSFHTLSVLVRIMLHPSLIRAGACVTSTPGPNACADPRERAQQRLPVRVPESARMPSPHAVLPEAAGTTPAASEGARYSVLRLRPFGALVSDLLLACLCVSFLLEILSHTLQPRPIRRPLLATVVGAVSLLFNGLMLVWRRGRGTDAGSDGSSTSPPAIQYNHFNTTKNKAHTSDSPRQSSHAEDAISHDSTGFQVSQHTFCLTGPRTEVANNNICVGCTVPSVSSRPPASGWCNQDSSRTGQQWQDIIWRTVTMIQGLLASVLVLVNGLLPLTLGPDCLPSLWGCHLLMYMDPGFSTLTVLVLLVGTLPELRRYGLVLLQACPAHVHAQELSAHVGRVSGVIAVHELHVWQLSALQLVASVHVHCLSGLGPLEYSGLLTAVTDVLKGFGLSHCTVQLEFLESASSQGQSTKTAMANSAEQTPCSLHCGEKCAKMMCCSPPQEQSCSTVPSSMDVEVKQQDIVVENTYL